MKTPRISTEYDSGRRSLFKRGDICLVVGGHGCLFKRVEILDHLKERRGDKFYYHRYTAKYLNGSHAGRVRKFHSQYLILESDYPPEMLSGG